MNKVDQRPDSEKNKYCMFSLASENSISRVRFYFFNVFCMSIICGGGGPRRKGDDIVVSGNEVAGRYKLPKHSYCGDHLKSSKCF